ncbi:MAG: hypothetical protein UX27_C0027G0011 [Candidatus Azambacteria bacterium GW2011_GWA2_45_90]|uniref:Uncharacterized protein n=1 Tax=Candidatus Azambacteria bacterium GW2011_GWA2_45_90 TaxID=1618614 RepID=A0A0G1NB31_9BACT|nr:MAG: hypothetical protein UX27_C0027G0011 [Candidatus Azambacteria bacterium GW2011_GWA2_45_90]
MYYMKNIEINQQKEKPLFRGKVANLDRFLFLGSTQEDERGEQDDSHQRQSDVFGRKLKTEVLVSTTAWYRLYHLYFIERMIPPRSRAVQTPWNQKTKSARMR